MFGATLALLMRSLRAEVRQPLGHLVRLGFVVLILGMLCLARLESGTTSAPGLQFFELICWLNLVLITLAGATLFATVITEEKEEFTLGLLTMAGVSPLALLLGKSTARLIFASLVLSVQFPFTLLSITLGGVTWGQVTAAYAALMAYLVLVANLGLLCSVCCRSSTSASKRMIVLLLIQFLIHPVVWRLDRLLTLASWTGSVTPATGWLEHVLEQLAIAECVNRIMQTGFAKPAWSSLQVRTDLGLACASFIVAWGVFKYCTQESPDNNGGGTFRQKPVPPPRVDASTPVERLSVCERRISRAALEVFPVWNTTDRGAIFQESSGAGF